MQAVNHIVTGLDDSLHSPPTQYTAVFPVTEI